MTDTEARALVESLRWQAVTVPVAGKAADMIESLLAERGALAKDAARWRAIRQCRKTVQIYVYDDPSDPCSGGWQYRVEPEEFDAFADAAMGASDDQ